MKLYQLIAFILAFIVLPLVSYGGSSKMKDVLITEEQAIKIAQEYLEGKEYNYEIDWNHPKARIERRVLKSDGSLSSGFGKRILVWHVWFLPLGKMDTEGKVIPVGVDINPKTGEIFTKYSLDKL